MPGFSTPLASFALGTSRKAVPQLCTLRMCGKRIIDNCGRDEQQSCWKCDNAVNCTKEFFCQKCHTLQPPANSANYFEYLGLPTQFNVSEADLKKKFRDRQFLLHPDKFVNSSESERELSDEHSRMLNTAYRTLSEPFRRAKYLVEILSGEKVNDEKAKLDLDPDELMEMMEWNERVADLISKAELESEKKQVQAGIDRELSSLGAAFEAQQLDKAKPILTKLSYLYSLKHTIDKRLEEHMKT